MTVHDEATDQASNEDQEEEDVRVHVAGEVAWNAAFGEVDRQVVFVDDLDGGIAIDRLQAFSVQSVM